MKYAIKFSALAMLLTILLTGCYPTGEKELPSESSISETQSEPERVSEKVGDMEFDYEIPSGYPSQMEKIKLKLKELDEEKVKNILLRDKTIVEDAERPDWWIETTDKSLLQFNYGFTFYDGRVDDNRSNCVTMANINNKFCRSSSEQLKSFSSKDAIERVNTVLNEIGIENYGEPCVIPITLEMGNARLKEHGVTGEKDQSPDDYDLWTEDDEIYILKYKFNYNGADVCSGSIKTLESARTIEGADITAYVNKNLIFYLDVSAVYDVVSPDEEKVDLKYGAGYASNQLIEHYSKIKSLKYPSFITGCGLEYAPVEYTDSGEIVFAPVWCFSGYQLKGANNDKPDDFAVYYYAETGIRYGSF